MPAELLSSSDGQTMVLTLRNVSYRNALGPEMYAAGVEALNAAGDNPDIRSVVIVGDGATFSAGGNLQRLQANRQQDPRVQADSIDGLHLWIEEIRTFPKPVIAAVEGAAAGAGFSLALACDFIVAAHDAVFATSYVGVGLSPDGGCTWHLGKALPRQLVTEFLMLGKRIPSERLLALGLINSLVAPGSALTESLLLAARLNAQAPNALASIKELLTLAEGSTLAVQLTAEREHFVCNLHHPNAELGIGAFLAKEHPRFQ